MVSKRKQALKNFLSVERFVCMNSFSSYILMSGVRILFQLIKVVLPSS